jgi:hypothetical protein
MTAVGRSRAPRALVCWGIGILLIGMVLAEPVQAQILEIDALLALKRLAAAATRDGLTYQEYARQLPATKRAVDRFLQSPGGAPSAIPMALAMAYYELAGATWRASIERSTAGYVLLGQRLEQDHGVCPHITGLIETATAKRRSARSPSSLSAARRDREGGNEGMASGAMGLRCHSACRGRTVDRRAEVAETPIMQSPSRRQGYGGLAERAARPRPAAHRAAPRVNACRRPEFRRSRTAAGRASS